MSPSHLVVTLQGRRVEVPRATLDEELRRSGAVTSLALLEALRLHAPRAAAIDRLARAIDAPAGTIGLATLLALVELDGPAALLEHAATQPGPLGTLARVAALVLANDADALETAIRADDAMMVRTPLVVAALRRTPTFGPRLFATLLEALQRLQPTLGITAYRAFLGDVAEASFRQLQLGASADGLLGDERGPLIDRLTAELGGTPDLVAARGMTWLLGSIAATDDAARSAIERARDRFRDPAFHADCDAILAARWPP